MSKWTEATYFARAKKLPEETQHALRTLYALHSPPHIRVEFGEGASSPRFKVFATRASSASIVMPQADKGDLFLPFAFHKRSPEVIEALGAFATGTLGLSLKANWRSTKPYLPASKWVPHVEALCKLLRSLAKESSSTSALDKDGSTNDSRAASSSAAQSSKGGARSPGHPLAAPAQGDGVHQREPAVARNSSTEIDTLPGLLRAAPSDPMVLVSVLRRLRRGQPQFRASLIAAYEGRCCISGWQPSDVLEAAHIVEHFETGDNSLDNGLLLRADLHVLFDEGLLRIHPDSLTVILAESLRSSPYWELSGHRLRSPMSGAEPSREKLLQRWRSRADARP